MPKISVVIGAYNIESIQEQFYKSMNSLLTQTFDDFEIIICNDGSTDKTEYILDNFQSCHDNVKVIHNKKNSGLSFALNTAIENSNGEYIARMDVDDISIYDRFEKQIDFLENNEDISFVGSNIAFFDDIGIWKSSVTYPRLPSKNDFLWSNPYAHPSIIIRKAVLNDVENYTVSKLTRRCEDYDLYCKMFLKGYVGANLQEVYLNYRSDRKGDTKRKYRYRIDEFQIRLYYYYKMGLLPKGFIYAIKPLVVGLIPKRIINFYKEFRA